MKSLQIHQKITLTIFYNHYNTLKNEYFTAKSSSIAQYIMDWSTKGVLCV